MTINDTTWVMLPFQFQFSEPALRWKAYIGLSLMDLVLYTTSEKTLLWLLEVLLGRRQERLLEPLQALLELRQEALWVE